jgi:hypothetical protein
MMTNWLAGIKVDRLLIPALSVIFSVLSLGYLILSSLVLFLFIFGALIFDWLSDDSWFGIIFFAAITFLSFKVVIALPLHLERAVFFTCLLVIIIIIMLAIGIGFRLPVLDDGTVSNPYVLNFLISGVSFGFIIGISIKIFVYGLLHSLVVGRNIPPVSSQIMVISVLAGILIGVTTGIQLSFIRLMQLEGFISNYGFLTGCIAFLALLLSTKVAVEENTSNIS